MDQKKAVASLHASLGFGQRKARPSPAAKRKEIQAGQVAVLERVLLEIRRRGRETRAWANGYNSAATVVELELASVRGAAAPALPAAVPEPQGCKWVGGTCECTRAQAQRCEIIDSRMPAVAPEQVGAQLVGWIHPPEGNTTAQYLARVRDEALTRAADLCGAISEDYRDQYKGRGKYAADNLARADTHYDGMSSGASDCEDAIRAMISQEGA